jgi:hypothetical protein
LILDLYKSRFQIEFLYRDTKQFKGLNDCEARSENKLKFHFNASLTTINLAKIGQWLGAAKEGRVADSKTIDHCGLLLDRFISELGIHPNTTKNKLKLKQLIRKKGFFNFFQNSLLAFQITLYYICPVSKGCSILNLFSKAG